MQMYYSGVVNGSSGVFRPEYKTTRLEAATVLVKALNLSTANRPNPNLRDVKPGQPGYDIVATVVNEGIFSGSNGHFNPNSYLTREQMAKILVNAFELTGNENLPFTDIKQDQWSREYISTLLANKVTTPSTHYKPSQHTTNAQFISFVRRSLVSGVK
ncbi:S-layer homology domain-containing protein [Bacillus sp. CGMCC 1.16541]|uniref:S-layer homology domain-containing protein n=1 Tax=Bacillus sp. CGMCC 1.16541 TaxID=2185143 RepID=UPI001EF74DEC|nr:S-layer homology domain-containing protein [Bacillus sp. CGMCC 1.16541]